MKFHWIPYSRNFLGMLVDFLFFVTENCTYLKGMRLLFEVLFLSLAYRLVINGTVPIRSRWLVRCRLLLPSLLPRSSNDVLFDFHGTHSILIGVLGYRSSLFYNLINLLWGVYLQSLSHVKIYAKRFELLWLSFLNGDSFLVLFLCNFTKLARRVIVLSCLWVYLC